MEYRISELEEKIAANLSFDWTTEKMAEFCELSKDHFHKLFKLVTKQTPIQFLKTTRLEEAQKLLETTKKPIKEIAYSVGINDQTHFDRDFKKAYGFTPSQYRQHHHDKIQAEKLKNPMNDGNG